MIPYAKQETDYFCGPAVVQMLLARIGIIFSQEQLAKELGTNDSELKADEVFGTSADAIVHLLKLHGMTVERRNGAVLDDIKRALAENRMALVGFIDPESSEPHYALVAALGGGEITLIDPEIGERRIFPLKEFEERWPYPIPT